MTCVRPGWTRTRFHDRAGQTVHHLRPSLWHDPDDVAREALAAHSERRLFTVPRLSPAIEARILAGKIVRQGTRRADQLAKLARARQDPRPRG